MTIQIMIADDQPLVRQGLRMYLTLDNELQIIAEADNGVEAVALADELVPDVILMDLKMQRMDGIEATARLRANGSSAAIIALSNNTEPALIAAMMEAGANAYLYKGTQTDKLISTIKQLAPNKVSID